MPEFKSQRAPMPHHRTLSPLLLATNLLALLSACAGGMPTRSPDGLGASRAPNVGESLNVIHGEIDYDNDYLSVVAITRQKSRSKAQDPYCSGVLIHPRLVLTAGHCVCSGRTENENKIIDKSTCQTRATVATAVYERKGGGPPSVSYHEGTVLPHGDLKIVLQLRNSQGWTVLKSEADLAVILLDMAVGNTLPPSPIHTEDVHEKDPVTLVGYGAFDFVNGLYRYDSELTRRFGTNKVVATFPSGIFQINTPDPISGAGDSGGPCFLDDKLVGIISSSYPNMRSSITSTHRYSAWITQQIENVRKSDSRRTR